MSDDYDPYDFGFEDDEGGYSGEAEELIDADDWLSAIDEVPYDDDMTIGWEGEDSYYSA